MKRARNTFLISLTLWAGWQLGGVISEYRAAQPLELKETTQLVSNTKNKIRTSTKKNFNEGIQDARFLLEHTAKEEAWLYDSEHEVWFEDGIDEFQFQNMSMLLTPLENIASLACFSNKIIGVHYHPHTKFFEEYRNSTNWFDSTTIANRVYEAKKYRLFLFPPENYQPLSDNEKIIGLFPDIPHAAPSIPDIISMIYRTAIVEDINKDLEYKSIICSQHGLTDYSVTELGMKRYKEGNTKRLFATHVPIYFFYEDGTRELQDPYIHISFTPYKDSLDNSLERVVSYEAYKKQTRKKKVKF